MVAYWLSIRGTMVQILVREKKMIEPITTVLILAYCQFCMWAFWVFWPLLQELGICEVTCPLKITKPLKDNPSRMHSTRNGNMLEMKGKSEIVFGTFINDGIRLWNNAPLEIKNCASIFTAKRLIKAYAESLPV